MLFGMKRPAAGNPPLQRKAADLSPWAHGKLGVRAVGGDGEGEGVDGAGAGRGRGLGAGFQRGAGRVHVVDQQQTAPGDSAVRRKRAGDVLPALSRGQADLLASGLYARQPGRFQRQARRPAQPRGQQFGLVIAAFLAPLTVERDGHDCIDGRGQRIPRRRLKDGDEVTRQRPGQLRAGFVFQRVDGLAQLVGVQSRCARKSQVRTTVATLAAQRNGCRMWAPTDGADLRGERGDQLGAAIAERLSRRVTARAAGREEQVQRRIGCTAQPDRPRRHCWQRSLRRG